LRETRSAPCRASQTSSLLDVVRQATGSAHRALEARLDLNDGSWTAERYVAFLRATLSVIQPLEDTITRQLQLVDRTAVGDRASERLTHDLERLAASASVQPAALAPSIDTPAQAFGAAYVLRGSLLGGQIIARTLEDRLHLDRACFTYLRPDGTPAGEAWRAFTARLNDFGRSASIADWDDAASTARAMFRAFDAAFTDEDFA